MTNFLQFFEWFELAAFLLAVSPAVIRNLQDTTLQNQHVLILLAAGLVVFFSKFLAGVVQPIPILFWTLGPIAMAALFFVRVIGGGGSKFTIALIPWFSFLEYCVMLVLSMLALAVIALVIKSRGRGEKVGVALHIVIRSVGVALPIVIGSVAVKLGGIFQSAG